MNQNVFLQSQNLIYRATYFYYVKNYNQTQIAKELNVSTATVSRLLKQATEQELVHIHIDGSVDRFAQLEQVLKKLLPLQDIIVAPDTHELSPFDSVALECARYLQSHINPDTILGISFGRTFIKALQFMNPCRKTDARYVMMHGVLPPAGYEDDLEQALYIFKNYMGGSSYVLKADAFITNEHVYAHAMSQKNSIEIFNLYPKLTMSIGSIGNAPVSESTLILESIDSPEILDYIKQDPSILSEFCMRFYDQDGNECVTPFSQWTMAISAEQYKRFPLKIIVASGLKKLPTLKAIIRGGMADVLIIDQELAQSLLASFSASGKP